MRVDFVMESSKYLPAGARPAGFRPGVVFEFPARGEKKGPGGAKKRSWGGGSTDPPGMCWRAQLRESVDSRWGPASPKTPPGSFDPEGNHQNRSISETSKDLCSFHQKRFARRGIPKIS